MPRSYPLRWLALALGFGLIGTQCQDSLSDDCTKTLTCPENEQPVLDENCVWRYPNSNEIWTGGPAFDMNTGRWRWPDGKETATQEFNCTPVGIGDAGTDGGSSRRCSDSSDCDVPLVCDTATRNCVECLVSTDCADNVAIGDAGAAIACDQVRHECVPCVQDSDCSGDVPVCKKDIANSSRNECVQCTADTDCGGDKNICDTSSNECTSSCTSNAQCTGEKSVCNTTTQLCVECTDNTTCSGSAPQCNTTSNECVQCVDDAPCTASGRVCDTTSNNCVQCTSDQQCGVVPNAPRCDLETNLCVECLLDTECTAAASSRCNPVSHLCVGCTEDTQCEGDLRCNTELSGRCVQCLSSSDCPSAFPVCETTSGTCKECLTNAECLLPVSARCETAPGATQYTCVGCLGNQDCSGGNRNLPGLCDTDPNDRVCVECLTDGDCSADRTRSNCGNGGVCGGCQVDGDCGGRTFGGTVALQGCAADNTCVQCTNSSQCSGATPACKLNNDGQAEGPAALNTCVECQNNTDCTDPNASRCVDNECVACQGNGDCSHLDTNGSGTAGGTLGVCDGGTCVECTGPQRGACGTSVCDSTTRQCTTFPVGSAALCGTCVSDAHCDTDQRCATHLFGATALGPFCFPLGTGVGGDCSLTPYSAPTPTTTVDGVTANLCLLRRTTCTGLGDVGEEDCTADADCGEAGLDDGRCDEGTGICSIPCTSNIDCFDPDQNSCLGGVCQL
jgi:hypothetical protein